MGVAAGILEKSLLVLIVLAVSAARCQLSRGETEVDAAEKERIAAHRKASGARGVA
jgi:hypothetical protein